jgi:hypothetical protein
MRLVVVCLVFGLPIRRWQALLGTVKCLDVALFVDRKNDLPIRRAH